MNERVLDELESILSKTGNKYVSNILKELKDNPEQLYLELRKFNSYLCYNTDFLEEESEDIEDDFEGEETKPKGNYNYIYLSDTLLNVKNIDRVEPFEDYSTKKKRMEYGLMFYKKFVTPEESSFCVYFYSEEDRDKGIELLRAKMKVCNIYAL